MGINWNGMRASAGAAALAIALVAGAPAQARMYKFTMTEQDADGSTNVGSGIVDTSSNYVYNSAGSFIGNYSMTNSAGRAGPTYNNFRSALNISNYNGGTVQIGTESFRTVNGTLYYVRNFIGGQNPYLTLFAPASIASGLFDEFKHGQYDISNSFAVSELYIFDLSTYQSTRTPLATFSPLSMTLQIGPAAPAPLVGGGLLSALAALLGLAMTRFGRRRNALA
jgi:hypothetical protein